MMIDPMKNIGKWMICAVTLVLTGLILLCGRMDPLPEEAQRQELPFSVKLREGEENHSLWYDSQGTFYAFLPAYAEPENLTLIPNPGSGVLLDGYSPEELPGIVWDKEYSLQWQDREQTYKVVFLKSENLPALYVDVRSGNMDYIHAAKGNEEPGSARLYGADGVTAFSGSLQAVKGRGNATWDQEKKPYTLQLRGEADLLGMGSAANWILLPNCMDSSNVRNKLILDYALEMGLAFTPQCRWVELYLNGEYAGLYLLCEKNEVHPQRVDIPRDTGFLISREKTDRVLAQDFSYVTTRSGAYLRVHHSDGDLAALQGKLQALENALTAASGTDPDTGVHWLDMIDLDSWVQKYLLEEISGNLDAGAISQFLYSDGSGKIFAGPAWDYDMSAGNRRTWQIDTPNMLYAGRPHLWSGEDTSSWFYHLSQKPEFRRRLEELYTQTFRPGILRMLEEDLTSCQQQIRQAARLNSIRWSGEDTGEKIAALRTYLEQRIAFLDSIWLEGKPYHTVEIWIREHILACYAVADGETVPFREVPYGTETIVYEGWYDAQKNIPFDFSAPITGDTLVYLKETETEQEPSYEGGLSAVIKYVPAAAMLALMCLLAAAEKKRPSQVRGEREKQTGDIS